MIEYKTDLDGNTIVTINGKGVVICFGVLLVLLTLVVWITGGA